MWQYRHTSSLMHSAYADRPYYAVEYSDDLYHYGVLGMKWGIRKERPSSGTGRGRGRKKLTAKQKKILRNIAIGAGATAATAAAGYGIYRGLGGKQGIAAGKKMFGRARGINWQGTTNGAKMERAALNNTLTGYSMSNKAVGRGAKLGAALGRSNVIKRAESGIRSIGNTGKKVTSAIGRNSTVGAARNFASTAGSQAATRAQQYTALGMQKAANTSRRIRGVIQNPTSRQGARAIGRTAARVGLAGGAVAGGIYGYNQYKKKKRS